MKIIDVTNLPNDALIRLPTVIALTGRGRSSIYEGMTKRTFPNSVKIGPRAVAFKLGDIREWLNSKSLKSNSTDGKA